MTPFGEFLLIIFCAICFAGLLSATGLMEFANIISGWMVVAVVALGVPWLAYRYYCARRHEAREARRARRYSVEDGGDDKSRRSNE